MARPTPVEMTPVTTSTLDCKTSLRKRSTVSFGFDSSSTTSSTLRPRMPPPALIRSTAHCVPRSPDSPTGAVTPALAASTPIFTGPACASAGAGWRGTAAPATAAAPEIFRNCRRVVRMDSSLKWPGGGPGARHSSAPAEKRGNGGPDAKIAESCTSGSGEPAAPLPLPATVRHGSVVTRRASSSGLPTAPSSFSIAAPAPASWDCICSDAAAAPAAASVHRPHPLGSHPGLSLLRARLPPRCRAERLRAARVPAEPGGGDGRTDGVLVLSREAARPAVPHPLHRAGGRILPRGRRARGNPVFEPYGADDRLSALGRRCHHRLRHRSRTVLEAGQGLAPSSRRPAARCLHA